MGEEATLSQKNNLIAHTNAMNNENQPQLKIDYSFSVLEIENIVFLFS